MRVIGTAGHVDHGKSTLIAALTGTHPDRLKEEQAREMTIDLGFGWLTLPNGEEIGIVDVPGHRDFIENMLAGIGGIDAALLVIAVDEGIMPQTEEHLAIIDLLQIRCGVIILTKTDLIADQDWIEALESDIRQKVKGNVLQDAPIVRVSARTRSGLDYLVKILSEVLGQQPPRPDLGRPRLPIDRVFTMSGFGTVVTGTLNDGHLKVGGDVQILPSGLTGRVRGLQTHKKKEDRAEAGSRTAVNISGIAAEQIRRGEVLTRPGQYQVTRRVDARFRLLAGASSALQHRTEVKVFLGTTETMAVLRLLGTEELVPGQEGWIQLELREPLVAVRGDRYILRRPSPAETLGGGMIIDAQPEARHKRFDAEVLKSLDALARGSPGEILLASALVLNASTIQQVIKHSQLERQPAEDALRELLDSGQLVLLDITVSNLEDDALIMARPHWDEVRERVTHILSSYHGKFPLRRGIGREELKSRLNLSPRLFNAILSKMASENVLLDLGNSVALAGHTIQFNSAQQVKTQALLRRFANSPYSPPSIKESQAEAGEDIVSALIESGELVAVSGEVVFRKQDYDSMVTKLSEALKQNGQVTLAEVRDLFDTSRKYAQALLEHLDAIGITKRESDFRKLIK